MMAEMIKSPEGEPDQLLAPSTRGDVLETRIRLPRKVVHELKRIADETDKTMNALIAAYIDVGLKADGRPSIHDRAPWFKDYLRRKGGRDSLGDRPVDNDEDFT